MKIEKLKNEYKCTVMNVQESKLFYVMQQCILKGYRELRLERYNNCWKIYCN